MNNPLMGHFRRMDVPSSSAACSPESLFNVHWDDFNRVVVDSLWTLLAEESLTDCTLVVSPSEQVQVHRVVLSANSPYFRSLLQAHSQHPNPIIILQDVSYSTLKMLVTFMYRGQVSVTSDEMTSLLKAADHLQIIGLTQTRRSPVNFLPTTPTGLGPGSVGGSSSGGGGGGGTVLPDPTILLPESAQQVYSKKARILEQNKNATSAIVTTNSTTTIVNNGGSTAGPPTLFRDNSRDYEMSSVERESRADEQQSPLSLKKEDESESNDWEDKHSMEEHNAPEQASLCLRYCCPYCSTNFPSQSSLSRHIMVLHPTVYSALYEPGSSSQAGSGINAEREPPPASTSSAPSSPPMDTNHILLDNVEELADGTAGILCKFCGKPFPEVSQLIQHLPIHTGERPFKCEFCGKAFKLRHHMKDHARVHTGERPFRCGLCGKTFSRSTILKAHEKTHFPKSSGGST